MEPRKQAILNALDAFTAQRSGMDFRNYGDIKAYRAEQRSVTRDLHDYRAIRAEIMARPELTADMILEASRSAYSGRLTLIVKSKGLRAILRPGEQWAAGDSIGVEYCTGQYFPIEYRRAACAVLASALWYYVREHEMPETERDEHSGQTMVKGVWQTPGDWIRAHFRKMLGRRLAGRFFD